MHVHIYNYLTQKQLTHVVAKKNKSLLCSQNGMLKLYLQGKQFNKYCLTTNSFKHKAMSGGSAILGYALLCYICSDKGPLSLRPYSKTTNAATIKN